MESVYNRLAILYGGQMAAIGRASDVVRSLTTGYSVHIKLTVLKVYLSSQCTLAECKFFLTICKLIVVMVVLKVEDFD